MSTISNTFAATAQTCLAATGSTLKLNLIRDHIATSLSIEADDFDYAPFSQRGGLGKAHQLFGADLASLLNELNEVLTV